MAGRSHSGSRLWLAVGLAAGLLAGCEQQPEGAPALGTEIPSPPTTTAPSLPDRPLRIGKTPPFGASTPRNFEPFTRYLSAAVDHEVTVVVARSYDDAITQLTSGAVDFSLISPFAYVKAKEQLATLRPLASIMRAGNTKYRGYIVVRAGSGLSALADLKGKRFLFGDRSSTSGYLLPTTLLRAAGIDPAVDFASVEVEPDHQAILRRVRAGEADAGAVSSNALRLSSQERFESTVEIIAKSDWTPYDPFVAHPSVPPEVVERIRQALLELNTRTTEGREILSGMVMINGFVPVEDAAYEPLRRLQRHLPADAGD